MDSKTRSAVFASPPNTNRRFQKNGKKRKCSFGSAEKTERKQNRNKSLSERKSSQSLDLNFDSEYSPCLNESWADEVENQEKMQERARITHSKRHLELSSQTNEERKDRKPTIFRKHLQPILTDPHRINQRQKQLDMGKNTLGYESYIKSVARLERSQDDPWTPDKYQQCSTRSWQGQVKSWRRRLHMWDPVDSNVDHDPFSTSISFNSEGDTIEQDSDIFQDSLAGTCSQSSEETKAAKGENLFDEEVFASFNIDNSDVFDILPV